jgi:tetratricopeptide (TPR) repeat protein
MSRPDLGALLAKALRHHQSGAITEAERLCRDILAADPDSADAWNMLALALYQQQRLDEAARAAERATSLRPKIAPYWLTRGNIEAEAAREPQAQGSFRRAIALNASLAQAYYGLARSLHRQERLAEAVAAYRRALRAAPEVAEIHFHLARALLRSERLQEALEEFEQAFARDRERRLDRGECFERFTYLKFASLPDFWHAELVHFLADRRIDKSRFMTAGLNVLRAKPEFKAALELAAKERARAANGEAPR